MMILVEMVVPAVKLSNYLNCTPNLHYNIAIFAPMYYHCENNTELNGIKKNGLYFVMLKFNMMYSSREKDYPQEQFLS